MSESLAARVQRLEDVEALRTLKSRYCYLADAAYADADRWQELVDHFTDDAHLDFGAYGQYRGTAEVLHFFREVSHAFLSFAAHMVSNPIIQVDGDRARGSWYFFCPSTERSTQTALWIQGRYRDAFARVDGRWKWTSVEARFDFVTAFDQGWAKMPAYQPPAPESPPNS